MSPHLQWRAFFPGFYGPGSCDQSECHFVGVAVISNNQYSVIPSVIAQFLAKTPPFCELDPSILNAVSGSWDIDYYPRGTLILRENEAEVKHFYLVQKGGVKFYSSVEKTVLTDFGGEGQAFGAAALVRSAKSDVNVEAVEDTFCFLLGKKAFLDFIHAHPIVAEYYLSAFSEELMAAAYTELRCEKINARKKDTFYLFNAQLLELVKNPPEIVSQSTDIRTAADRMSTLGLSSLLVQDGFQSIVGIITDKDLRSKVVAKGLSVNSPVHRIMTGPVNSISARALCFDALLQMMVDQVDHLAVEDCGEIVGVISAQDIMVFQGASPLFLFREATGQRKIEGLYGLAQRLPLLIRTLIEEGGKAHKITKMVTILNDHILSRLISLQCEEMGEPPALFCWLMLGSEGRKEQVFRTDQDNALVYEEPRGKPASAEAEAYFKEFTRHAVDHLLACGYPKCKQDIVASNPLWCKPYSVWESYFDHWMTTPFPREISRSSIFFDFRGANDQKIAHSLRSKLGFQAQRRHIFLSNLAGDCLRSRPPLAFFRNLIVEKGGDRFYRLDIKERGLSPFVNFARLMALKHGIEETNTVERMRLLYEQGFLARDLYVDMKEAYEFQAQLVLVHQLEMAESGRVPETFIDPVELSDLEKRTLKEVFKTINIMLDFLREQFPNSV